MVVFAITPGREVLGKDSAIRLHGLDPATSCRLVEINPAEPGVFASGLHVQEFSGDQLMAEGIRPQWKRTDCQSVVLRVEIVQRTS